MTARCDGDVYLNSSDGIAMASIPVTSLDRGVLAVTKSRRYVSQVKSSWFPEKLFIPEHIRYNASVRIWLSVVHL